MKTWKALPVVLLSTSLPCVAGMPECASMKSTSSRWRGAARLAASPELLTFALFPLRIIQSTAMKIGLEAAP